MGRKAKTATEIDSILKNNFNDIELISPYKTSKKNVVFHCKKCGHKWEQLFFNLSGCPNCKVDKRFETLSHEDYILRLSQKGIKSIIPIEKYITARTKIKHKCLVCNHEWLSKPNNILTGYGCPLCAGQVVVKGFNDLHTTEPNVAGLLLNSKDGFLYSRMSNKKLDWTCPDCGSIVAQKSINNIVHQGLRCKKCSDGISIPNKLIANILDNVGINFESEKTFSWLKNRRYDVYIPSLNCIVEMHGRQHYDMSFEFCGGRTLTEEKENDELKRTLAYKNGIENYIVIDCRSSNLDWIKSEIETSRLSFLISFDSVNWDKCYKAALHSKTIEASDLWSKGYSTAQISKKLYISRNTVCDYLTKANRIGLCSYAGSAEKLKKVICLNTNEIFNSIKEATNKYEVGHIGACCRGERKFAGNHPVTGEKLSWAFKNS